MVSERLARAILACAPICAFGHGAASHHRISSKEPSICTQLYRHDPSGLLSKLSTGLDLAFVKFLTVVG